MYKKIINLTFQSVFDNKDILIKSLALSLGLLILFKVLVVEFPKINATYLLPVFLIINLHIAVITHRVLLLGKESISKWGITKYSKRELNFFLNSLLILLICIPFLMVGFFHVGILAISLILMTIVISRLSLVFPSIAIDENITITESWEFTKKYKLLMFFSVIIFPAIFSIIVGFVYNLVIGFLVGVISSKLYVLYPILDLFITVFIISALSSTYKIIKEEHPEFFEKTKQDETITTIINDNEKLTYDKNFYKIDFEILKEGLKKQYELDGFTEISVDNESSWMLKNPDVKEAYILLTKENDSNFLIETFNTNKASLEFLEVK